MERKFRITVDGRAFNVTVEDLSEGNTLYPSPGSMQIHAPVGTPSVAAPPPVLSTPPAAVAPGAVVSSLGGVVDAVHVSVGQGVAAGDKIVTIEAMKMKNAIVATAPGTVRAVLAKAGDTVDAGQVLVELG